MVEVERRCLAADPRQPGEVVPRRRATRGPLQRPAPAPRIVGVDQGRVARDPEVPEPGQHRDAEQEGTERRDLVEEGEAFGRKVVRDASLHLSLIHISEPTRRTPISYA